MTAVWLIAFGSGAVCAFVGYMMARDWYDDTTHPRYPTAEEYTGHTDTPKGVGEGRVIDP